MGATVQGGANKNVFFAYFWWLIGGIFGFHHLYLRRDAHAFLTWSTFGGYFGVGWVLDFFKIPRYVREVNQDPKAVKELVERIRNNEKKVCTVYGFYIRRKMKIRHWHCVFCYQDKNN